LLRVAYYSSLTLLLRAGADSAIFISPFSRAGYASARRAIPGSSVRTIAAK
jgi:hypothetical protein